ncbi:MAG TPA: hypothetical protein VFF64_05045 [Candidatus Eremiobacteraceae bacterium]|nr:hypothetical protein [Candidatus Eremiobacteraceae bacterium]
MPTAQAEIKTDNTCLRPFDEEERPMTMHVVLPTRNLDGLVWVTDDLNNLGNDNPSHAGKIKYLDGHNVACSAWGSHALTVRDTFADRIEDGSIKLNSNRDSVIQLLRSFALEMVPEHEKILPPLGLQQPNRGLLVLTLFTEGPRLYHVNITATAPALYTGNWLVVGDDHNPANIFADYYYRRSGYSVSELLSMGIHTMRLAHMLKPTYIGNPDAWFYDGEFRQLAAPELEGYMQRSVSLDQSILGAFAGR